MKTENNFLQRVLNGERLKEFPVIDHHGHFRLTPGMLLKEEVAMIVAEMDNCGVQLGVVFNVGNDFRSANDSLLEGMSFNPKRFVGYAFLRLDHGTEAALKELERCRKCGLKGLKLHASYRYEDSYHSEKFRDIWDFCAEHKWPIIIHGLPVDLPGKYPDTVFVGAHQIERVRDENSVKTLLECPNYFWCVSATFCLKGAIEKIVSCGGADKLLFGSDFPGNSLSARLGSVLGAEIDESDMKKILGGNAIRLLNLDERLLK